MTRTRLSRTLAVLVVVCAMLGFSGAARASVTVPITNVGADGRQLTRFDTAGNAVDAHDGAIVRFGSTYYLYGTSYDCGYQWTFNSTFCGFKVYSSPDLNHWTDRGYVAKPRSCAYCFRPHVVYDAATHRYVMWVNDQDATDKFRVYTAHRPTGPFTEAPVPDLPDGTSCSADLAVFVDHDGTGYLTCSRANWHLAVIQLTPDYLRASGAYTVVGVTKVEAPSLFERDGTYYLTMSDPNCGYCTGTGTSYLTAPSPLGPWTGQDAWTVHDGSLSVHGGLYGLSKAGADWTDYTMSADTAPQENATGTLAQAGLAVRMSSLDNGYLVLLTGHGDTAPGQVSVLTRTGKTVTSKVVTLDRPVPTGAWQHLSVTVAGSTISVSLNGTDVLDYTDTTYPAGGVGLREYNGASLESALFDNVTVTTPGGTTLLSDDFGTDDLSQWVPPTAGIKISDTSCGGQPAQVATLTDAAGHPLYLYFSDLWTFHTNEALANYDWEPLSFTASGAINPLTCKNSTVSLAVGHPGRQDPVRDLDQTSGVDGYGPTCAVTGDARTGQSFTVGRTGRLSTVDLTVFQDGTETDRVLRHPPDAPLRVALTRVGADGLPTDTVWSTELAPASVGWSARLATLRPNLRVHRGDHLAVVLSTAASQGCYGVERDPENPYRAGTALTGTGTLTAEPGTDLKFQTTVGR